MKVVFLDNVEGTAQVGEVKEVRNGFARNFLLPRGLAAPAIEPYLERARARAVREEKRQADLDQEAETIAERIDGSRISIPARVGEQGKLYGSVTGVHIAEEVGKLINAEDFDHRKVLLPEAIKAVGLQPVRVRLTRNVETTIEVEVYPEGEEPGSGEAYAKLAEAEAAGVDVEAAVKLAEKQVEAEAAAPAESEEPAAETEEAPTASETEAEAEAEEPAGEPEAYEEIEEEADKA